MREIHRIHKAVPAIVIAAAAMLILGSCGIGFLGPPPVEFGWVEVIVGDRGSLHRTAGLYFTIANTTDVAIEQLEIAFSLFTDGGQPVPGPGANNFRTVVPVSLNPRARLTFCTSLDASVPADVGSLAASRFRVTEARFCDGSVWRNTGAVVYRGGVQ